MVVAVGLVVYPPGGVIAANAVMNAGVGGAVASAGAAVGSGAAVVAGAAAGATNAVATALTGLTTASGAANAIASAVATGTTVGGAVVGTVAGGAAQGAVTAITTGAVSTGALSGAATASTFAGPIGWAILGANGYTWDCWKPVVIDKSIGPSRGITLRDLYNHPNLRRITINGDGFIAENVRNEQFHLSPVDINGSLAFHATPA